LHEYPASAILLMIDRRCSGFNSANFTSPKLGFKCVRRTASYRRRTPSEICRLYSASQTSAMSANVVIALFLCAAASMSCRYAATIASTSRRVVAVKNLRTGLPFSSTPIFTDRWYRPFFCLVIGSYADLSKVSLHMHDAYGMGLANVYVALKEGITAFDASLGGMGGCPFVPGAKGNISTEDLVYMLHDMGIETGYDLGKLNALAAEMATEIQAPLSSSQSALCKEHA